MLKLTRGKESLEIIKTMTVNSTKPTLFELVYPSDEESPNDPPSSPLAMDDESYDNDDDYKYEMDDNAGSSLDNSDVELESEEH